MHLKSAGVLLPWLLASMSASTAPVYPEEAQVTSTLTSQEAIVGIIVPLRARTMKDEFEAQGSHSRAELYSMVKSDSPGGNSAVGEAENFEQKYTNVFKQLALPTPDDMLASSEDPQGKSDTGIWEGSDAEQEVEAFFEHLGVLREEWLPELETPRETTAAAENFEADWKPGKAGGEKEVFKLKRKPDKTYTGLGQPVESSPILIFLCKIGLMDPPPTSLDGKCR